MQIIKTTGLTKYYGKNRGIIDLNLDVEEREFFGFIGPNGAGKSTTIRTLLGLINQSGGSAQIYGMDTVKNKREILKQVGYLPSETAFYPRMRVRELLKFSAGLRRMDCGQEAAQLCERLRLDTSRFCDELSLGNRKKAAIVCALQHNPGLLILDEPTSGLDPLIQREFFKILHERNRKGATVFLSSHVLSEIQRHCTRAAIIREGRMAACGSVETLAGTCAKRITVHGEVHPENLPGVQDLSAGDGSVRFLYTGDMNELIRFLANCQVTDLNVAEPDLEEVFMHYYAEGGNTK